MDSSLSRTVRALWTIRTALWFMFLLSSTLIIAAAQGDLWFDEIWSIAFARDAHSVTDIFVRFHHDNNHPLNTVFLYYVKEAKILFTYRLFAVLSGIGSIFLIAYVANEYWGSQEALCSTVLAGTSYPLLLYFSEARGYAPMIFFALASYTLLRQNMQQLRLGSLVLFWLTSILGMLSHATFVIAGMAFCIGSLAHEIYAMESFRTKLLRFMAQHLLPVSFFISWYIFFVKAMEIGGGPIYEKLDVIAQASALSIGFPELYGFPSIALGLVAAFVMMGIISLRQENDTQWLFFLTILYLSPLTFLIVANPQYLYFRYLIVCFPFFYLLLSHLICTGYRSYPISGRWLLIAAIVILISGQFHRIYALITLGRGNYSAALAYIAEHSTSDIVQVGSDHDSRNRLLFDFYAPLIPRGNPLQYVEQSQWPETPPDWMITHSQEVLNQPPEQLSLEGIGRYRLAAEYRFSGMSGWNWFLFRQATPNREA